MRKYSFLMPIVLLFLLSSQAYAWKFAVFGDSRGSKVGVREKVLSPIVQQINKEKVELALFVGDAVNGSKDDAELGAQMDAWLGVMKGLNCPWYYTPGNHEISSDTSEKVLCAKIRQPMNGPDGYKGMVYSFDHKNVHFAILNSNHHGEEHLVQTSWLVKDLAAAKTPHSFVMAHEPAFSVKKPRGLDCDEAERDTFWRVLSRAGVAMYFCGHEHLYARSKHGSVWQVIAGTSGASISNDVPGTIAKFNYVIVDVDGLNVRCVAKDIDGKVIDSWDYAVPARKRNAN